MTGPTLHAVSPRQYHWWLAMALTTNPAYRGFARVELNQRAPLGGEDLLLVASDVVTPSWLQSRPEVERGPAHVVLWDGAKSFAQLCSRLAEGGRAPGPHWRYACVGDVPDGLTEQQVYRVLSQDEDDYHDYPRRFRREVTRRLHADPRTKARLLARPHLVSAKHLAQEPGRIARNGSEFVFAGQSGRMSLEYLADVAASSGRPTTALLALIGQARDLERGGTLTTDLDDMAERLVDEGALSGSGAMLVVRSLLRLHTLDQLRRAGAPLVTHFYPHAMVNIYQSRWLPRNRYLDFGGMNGSERVYPRAADLLVREKAIVRVVAPALPPAGVDEAYLRRLRETCLAVLR